MSIKGIVFDMDDTLYNEKDYVSSGLIELDKHIKQRFTVDGFYEAAINLYEKGERKLIFNKALEVLKIPFDKKFIHFLISVYRSHKPDIHLLSDAKWVLDNVAKDVKLGLISDGYLDAQNNKVKALRLKERFHSIILTDRFGREYWKPSKVPYQHACIELQLNHRECLYIGDNVSKDFVTAKKLGWITVQIERVNGVYSGIEVSHEYEAKYKIDTLKKLSTIPELGHLFIKQNESTYSLGGTNNE
jgi:putative hydrolase of the HAD superfamily